MAISIAKILLPNLWQKWEQQKAHLNDWPQLKVYQQSNLALAALETDEHRVVFFGDSITEFWDLKAAFPEKNYINRGISGQTTAQMLVRFRPDAISLRPKVIVILAGINDIAGNTGSMTLEAIEGNYLSMSQIARSSGISVIFASVLPIHDCSPIKQSDPYSPEKIRALNNWLQLHCNEQQHIYLDYHSHMIDSHGMLQTELSDDGVHPNMKGYKIMTALAETYIQKVFQQLELITRNATLLS
ncbi:GDSL-type esterase/lipase family protein [Pseudanabaena sp. PCC 6802]|uniref:GDSL-type esterase/lipase family protein n=1 Tax=Pseudanabaena sp. PCC 6802 TaxID=118173 RepID=UPI001930D2A4|nr:GDSL-type esterase/lipase family protein [Pseudanabaena sp. PCC 6802]